MKRRLVAAFIVGFALWPVVHYVLTQRFDTDPWKLFGWGMYSVPGAMKTVRVAGVTQDDEVRVIAREDYSEGERREARRFTEYRRALGELASPDVLVATVFENRPELPVLIVSIGSLELDPGSGRLVSSVRYTRYDREGRSTPLDPRLFGHTGPD